MIRESNPRIANNRVIDTNREENIKILKEILAGKAQGEDILSLEGTYYNEENNTIITAQGKNTCFYRSVKEGEDVSNYKPYSFYMKYNKSSAIFLLPVKDEISDLNDLPEEQNPMDTIEMMFKLHKIAFRGRDLST